MVLWWIGNAILLLVVVPVLVALLNRVLAALERIRGASDDILAGGVALIGELDDVPEVLADDRPDHPRRRRRRGPLRGLRREAARLSRERRFAMPAVAWVTLVIAALIIAAAALGLIRVILHLMAVRRDPRRRHRRGRGRRRPDQHRPRGAAVGQRRTSSRSVTSASRCEVDDDSAYSLAMASDSTTGWVIGYTIAIVVVLVVVALVVPILMLAHSIGKQADAINDSLTESVRQHRRAEGAEHDDRPRRGHRRRARPRTDQAGRLTMDAVVLVR